MDTLKYKVIKSKIQYHQYIDVLEELLTQNTKEKAIQEEIDLLTLLIEKWDEEHNSFHELNPIELLKTIK